MYCVLTCYKCYNIVLGVITCGIITCFSDLTRFPFRPVGVELDEVVVRAAPRRVLELGLGCGYSAVRTLRLLPPGGRLLAVEVDPLSAELGEELVLVAGFKHHQVGGANPDTCACVCVYRLMFKEANRFFSNIFECNRKL